MKKLTKLEKTVIDNIRRIRMEKGITQIRLAAFCDTSTSYIGLMESYKNIPKLSTIERIAEALNVDPIVLFQETDKSEKNNIISEEMKTRLKEQLLVYVEKGVVEILQQI